MRLLSLNRQTRARTHITRRRSTARLHTTMKIPITGARGKVGQDVVKLCEDVPLNRTDTNAPAKSEAELQARAFVYWLPITQIACPRIHEVAPRKDVQKEHAQSWEKAGVKQLWDWVHLQAMARACLPAVEKEEKSEGCEVFNILASTIAQDVPFESVGAEVLHWCEGRRGMGGRGTRHFGRWVRRRGCWGGGIRRGSRLLRVTLAVALLS